MRRACVKALGDYRKDAAVTAAIKSKLNEGDPSVEVEAALLRAYAHTQPPDVVAVDDAVPGQAVAAGGDSGRRASTGSAASQDLSVLDTLIAWTQRGKPLARPRRRRWKVSAELAKTGNPSDEQRKQIVTAVAAGLENEGRRVRTVAVQTLRELGQSAAVSLPALEAIAQPRSGRPGAGSGQGGRRGDPLQ